MSLRFEIFILLYVSVVLLQLVVACCRARGDSKHVLELATLPAPWFIVAALVALSAMFAWSLIWPVRILWSVFG